MLQAKLKVVGGRHHGKIIPLATRKFLIGREQDCHLRPNSELVSRHHCALWVDDFSVRVRDLGSTNGTFVNNQRVRGELVLGAGDHIRVGKLDFELLIGDLPEKK
ncbi:MAG TPA: FHA domain-containing protein, partial [Planctomycetaceae bacterium]|nr:FHA domain-containing protein [Planctomycetaceae bacterium]